MSIKRFFIVWFKAARAPFLVVSAIPAALGGAIAAYHGAFDWRTFVIAAVGVVMAHSAADFLDDYFDFQHGNLGNKVQQFHDSPLIGGEVTLRQVLIATILCAALAAGAGVYLLATVGMPVLIMGAVGGFIVLFYTSPPVRLNYRGLGETALFIAFGPALVFGVYFVLTRTFSWEPLLASLPLGIFTMNVGIVSNTFDHDDDVKSGKATLPVRLGQRRAVQLLAGVTVAAYLSVALGALCGALPLWALLGLLTLPLSVSTIRLTARYADLKQYTPAMGQAIALTSLMGVALTLAYLLAA